jgi:hypothetical protein
VSGSLVCGQGSPGEPVEGADRCVSEASGKHGSWLSAVSSQLSVLSSQFSVPSSQFSVLGSRFSVTGAAFRGDMWLPAVATFRFGHNSRCGGYPPPPELLESSG